MTLMIHRVAGVLTIIAAIVTFVAAVAQIISLLHQFDDRRAKARRVDTASAASASASHPGSTPPSGAGIEAGIVDASLDSIGSRPTAKRWLSAAARALLHALGWVLVAVLRAMHLVAIVAFWGDLVAVALFILHLFPSWAATLFSSGLRTILQIVALLLTAIAPSPWDGLP
jgi:hypothetical protein